jgi:CheY-like chemotaxis protein
MANLRCLASATAVPGLDRAVFGRLPTTAAQELRPDVVERQICAVLVVARAAGWHSALVEATANMETQATIAVLVVDDNQDLAENIAEILGLRGFAPLIATSAEEALPKALPDGPVLLVTDFRLPGMSGAELVRRVREQRNGVRAIVMSAYTDDETIAAAREAGANFLPKPVDLTALSELLTAA